MKVDSWKDGGGLLASITRPHTGGKGGGRTNGCSDDGLPDAGEAEPDWPSKKEGKDVWMKEVEEGICEGGGGPQASLMRPEGAVEDGGMANGRGPDDAFPDAGQAGRDWPSREGGRRVSTGALEGGICERAGGPQASLMRPEGAVEGGGMANGRGPDDANPDAGQAGRDWPSREGGRRVSTGALEGGICERAGGPQASLMRPEGAVEDGGMANGRGPDDAFPDAGRAELDWPSKKEGKDVWMKEVEEGIREGGGGPQASDMRPEGVVEGGGMANGGGPDDAFCGAGWAGLDCR